MQYTQQSSSTWNNDVDSIGHNLMHYQENVLHEKRRSPSKRSADRLLGLRASCVIGDTWSLLSSSLSSPGTWGRRCGSRGGSWAPRTALNTLNKFYLPFFSAHMAMLWNADTHVGIRVIRTQMYACVQNCPVVRAAAAKQGWPSNSCARAHYVWARDYAFICCPLRRHVHHCLCCNKHWKWPKRSQI